MSSAAKKMPLSMAGVSVHDEYNAEGLCRRLALVCFGCVPIVFEAEVVSGKEGRSERGALRRL